MHPQDGTAHLQLGRVLAQAGKYDGAINELQAALKIHPNDADAQRDLADAYSSAGKFDAAALQYQSLLGGKPNDAELHHSLGQAFLKQSKFPEAQQEFLTAIKLKPDFGAAYGDLAIAADKNKNYEIVIKALDVRQNSCLKFPWDTFSARPLMITCVTSKTLPRIIISSWIQQVASILIRSGRRVTD